MQDFVKIKQLALDFERNNYNYLQFVDSTNNFKQLFDHSALIFKSEIADKIGYKTVNLRPDISTTKIKAKYGLISFRNFDNLKKKLEGIGLVEDKNLKNKNIFYIKLLKIFTKSEIENMADALADQKQKFQKIISPQNPNPILFVRLEELEKMLYENLRQIHPFAQKTIGAEIFNLSAKSLELYLFYANTKNNDQKIYLKELELNLRKIRYNLKTVENLGLIHAKNLERILEEVAIIERIVKKESANAK